MKIEIRVQPSMRLMRLSQKISQKERSTRQFRLNKDIILSECLIDGLHYQINQRSRLLEDMRLYLLPAGAGNVELGYASGYLRETSAMLLFPEDLWYGDFEEDGFFEITVHLPNHCHLISNLDLFQKKEDVIRLGGREKPLLILGEYHLVRGSGMNFYLLQETSTLLLERAMQRAWRYVQSHFGRSALEYPGQFVELETEAPYPGRSGIQFIQQKHLTGYEGLLNLVQERIRQHYPMKAASDVSSLIEALYGYMAWRSLEEILSPSEREACRQNTPHHGPLSEVMLSRELGLSFYHDLECYRGVVSFDLEVQRFLENYRDQDLQFVHFYNHFGEMEETRDHLDSWLFELR